MKRPSDLGRCFSRGKGFARLPQPARAGFERSGDTLVAAVIHVDARWRQECRHSCRTSHGPKIPHVLPLDGETDQLAAGPELEFLPDVRVVHRDGLGAEMKLIGDILGRAPKDIADQLHLSPKTVAVHNANIRQKLKLRTSGELIRFAVQWEDMRNLGTM